MTRSSVAQLALKDLYLTRWIVAGAIASGAIALALMPLHPMALYAASVLFPCVLIVLNIFLVMSGVMQEKRDKVRLFVLSLPISTMQYTLAKMAANFTAFFVPWLLLTVASIAVIRLTAVPDGLIPITLVVSIYLLAYVLLAVAITTESQLWPGLVILIGNVSMSFVIPLLLRLPSTGEHLAGDRPVWGSDLIAVLGAAIAVAAAAPGLAVAVESRRGDFV